MLLNDRHCDALGSNSLCFPLSNESSLYMRTFLNLLSSLEVPNWREEIAAIFRCTYYHIWWVFPNDYLRQNHNLDDNTGQTGYTHFCYESIFTLYSSFSLIHCMYLSAKHFSLKKCIPILRNLKFEIQFSETKRRQKVSRFSSVLIPILWQRLMGMLEIPNAKLDFSGSP